MGEVYRARDPRIGREVAIKVLPASWSQDRERLRRFEQEARAAGALNHPALLTIHDFGEQNGAPYMVSELLEGETLRARLHGGPLSARRAIEYAIQIARGLAVAHGKGIIHRDIKPENIFITKDGRVKILDFGLAKLRRPTERSSQIPTMAHHTEPGAVMGTVGYMSPEQVRGEEVDQRSDIFSLGAVLYECLAGSAPFKRDSSVETMNAILKEEPPGIVSTGKQISPAVAKVVSRCLEKHREARYQSAADLAFHLEDLSDISSPAVRPSRSTRIPILVAAAILCLVALMVVVNRNRQLWQSGPPVRSDSISARIDSVAVLPFANDTGDPTLEYLSDGLTETLINALAERPGLRVVPRTTVFYYKRARLDPAKIGSDLHVRAIVTGRMIRAGELLQVQSEVVDVTRDAQIWGENFRTSRGDMLPVQQQIARDVLHALGPQLTPEGQRTQAHRSTDDREAFDLYLRGRYAADKRTPDQLEVAADLFNRAIERDPYFVPALIALANTYLLQGQYADERWSVIAPKTMSATERALQLDPSNADAHWILGQVNQANWNWAKAIAEYRRAIQLDPAHVFVRVNLAILLSEADRNRDALVELKRAKELDPLSSIVRANLARTYHLLSEIDHAANESRELVRLNPDFPMGHMYLSEAYARDGKTAAAVEEIERAAALSNGSPFIISRLGFIYAIVGQRDKALGVAHELEQRHQEVWSAFVYAGLHDNDRVFKVLNDGVRDHSPIVGSVGIWWEFQSLRNDPRWSDLMRHIGLPAKFADVAEP
jgi:serine/threonine protein kinase/tetratricopeptide (TPR) repeat protein